MLPGQFLKLDTILSTTTKSQISNLFLNTFPYHFSCTFFPAFYHDFHVVLNRAWSLNRTRLINANIFIFHLPEKLLLVINIHQNYFLREFKQNLIDILNFLTTLNPNNYWLKSNSWYEIQKVHAYRGIRLLFWWRANKRLILHFIFRFSNRCSNPFQTLTTTLFL